MIKEIVRRSFTMGELIDMATAVRAKRRDYLRGLSGHEREYAFKLVSIFRHDSKKRKSLEECIDFLYEQMNSESGQDEKIVE